MFESRHLAAVMPRLRPHHRERYLPPLQAACREFAIITPLRLAAFLAQLAHESGELRYWVELADGKAYEGRRDLGNLHPGDGPRYRGRGPIQLTGRANYRRYGRLLGVDLEGRPELAATPQVGFRVAGAFWQGHGLNARADRREFRAITRAINGGLNGWEHRLAYYRRALEVLQAAPAPPPPEPYSAAVTIMLGDRPLPEAQGHLRPPGRVWLALRPICRELGWTIVFAAGQWARVRSGLGESLVPLDVLPRGIGMSPASALRPLGLEMEWQPAASPGDTHRLLLALAREASR